MLLTQASTSQAGVAAAGVGKQKLAGALRISIASSLRRLGSSWQDTERARELAATDEQMKAFAQAGLRKATNVSSLAVVAASGGPSDWWVSYEVPTLGMGLTSVNSLSDLVQQKLSRLEDTNSPEFAAFARGALAAGSSLRLQSVKMVSGPLVKNKTAQYAPPGDVGRALPGTGNHGVLIVALVASLVSVSRRC